MSSVGERGIFTQMLVVTFFWRMREGRLNEVTTEHPHDITVALHGPVEKGLLMSEGVRPEHVLLPSWPPPDGGWMFGVPGICSKPSSEHLPESFEHLIASSEHLDTLREIARPVGSVRKASRKVAYRSRGAQANICGVRRFAEPEHEHR